MNVAATHSAARSAVGAFALAAVAVSVLAFATTTRTHMPDVGTSTVVEWPFHVGCVVRDRHLALRDVHVVGTSEAEGIRDAIIATAHQECRSFTPVTLFISGSGGKITKVTSNDGDDARAVDCAINQLLPTELSVDDDVSVMVSFDLVD